MHPTNPFLAIAPTEEAADQMLATARNECAKRSPFSDTLFVMDVLALYARPYADGSERQFTFDGGDSLDACYSTLTRRRLFPPTPPFAEAVTAIILDDRLALAFRLELGDGFSAASLHTLGEEDLRSDFYPS